MRHWFSDVRAFRRNPLDLLLRRARESGEALVPLALGPRPLFLVARPEWIKPILKAKENEIDKGRLVHKLRPVVGDSSLTISGTEHKRRRDAVGDQLARSRVERLIPPMAAEIRRFAAKAGAEISVEVNKVTPILALKLIALVLFGHDALAAADEHALIMAVRSIEDELANEMFNVLPPLPLARLQRRRRRAAAKATMDIVVRRVRDRATDMSVLRTLDRLGLPDQSIRDEVLTMLLAGHHTTGSAATWVLYHLATEPGLIDAIAAEAAEICDSTGELKPERVKSASLSLALVREVLRLYPSSWWFSREIQTPRSIAGRDLKPGTSLIISPWQMHRDPRYWHEADQFRLDRDFTTNKAYIPFGVGPRTCIGLGVALLELQLLALEIASAYRISNIRVKPSARPRPSLTLLPPEMTMDFLPREAIRSSSHESAA